MKWKSLFVIVLIIITTLTFCTNELFDKSHDLTPEETIELYFKYWNDKNDANMDSLIIESKRRAEFDLQDLVGVTLESYVEQTDCEGWNDIWFENPYEYTCVDVSFTIEYKDGSGGGFNNGTYKWQYYLVKETEDSDWIIVMWGSG